MKLIKYFTVLQVLILGLTSCHDDLNTEPISATYLDGFYNSSDEIDAGLNGVYNGMTGANGAYGQHFIAMSTHGSHVGTMHSNQPNLNGYARYTFDNSDKALTAIWESNYSIIYNANQVISRSTTYKNGLPDSVDTSLVDRFIGEAKFLRALAYFNLARFWGAENPSGGPALGVPLVTEELLDFKNTDYERAALTAVYDQIISDLEDAKELCYYASWIGKSPSLNANDLGRATKGAARGLLAKVYLTRATYPLNDASYFEKAYDEAYPLVLGADQGDYVLDASYANLFTVAGETSHEWMFQVNFHADALLGNVWGGVNNPSGVYAAINQGFGRYNPTLSFIESYELGDPRQSHNIAQGKIYENEQIGNKKNGQIVHQPNTMNWYCHKFRFTSKPVGRFQTDMNAPVLRFGDVLLVFAESAAKSNKSADAIYALNLILDRARNGGSLPVSVAETDFADGTDELINFIFEERARELCFEGHDKFDLIRTSKDFFEATLSSQQWTNKGVEDYSIPEANRKNVDWQGLAKRHHISFPIPESEMVTNSAMVGNQNPGYSN
jgi:starch-binding outer membrane protein, SusD/RagB family